MTEGTATIATPAEREGLRALCGSEAWIDAMLAAGSLTGAEAFHEAAQRAFDTLTTTDWLAAFAHHPRIGDRASLEKRFGSSGTHSTTEQAGVDAAAGDVLGDLFDLNEAYFARHGHIFIVCASGKTAAEMLDLLKARVDLSVADEVINCANEQRKITGLRIDKLFASP